MHVLEAAGKYSRWLSSRTACRTMLFQKQPTFTKSKIQNPIFNFILHYPLLPTHSYYIYLLSSELNFISLFSFRFDPLFSVSVMSEPRSYQARSRRLDPESNAPSTFPRTARVGSEPRFQVRKTGKKKYSIKKSGGGASVRTLSGGGGRKSIL